MSVLPNRPSQASSCTLRPPLSSPALWKKMAQFTFQIDGRAASPGDMAAAERETRKAALQATRDHRKNSARARRAAQAAEKSIEIDAALMGAALRRSEAARLREARRASPPKMLRVLWKGQSAHAWQPAPTRETAPSAGSWRVAADGQRSVVIALRKNGFGKVRSGRAKGRSTWTRGALRRAIRYILRASALESSADSIVLSVRGLETMDPREAVGHLLELGSAIENLEAAAAGDQRHLVFASVIIPMPAEISHAARREVILEVFGPYADAGLPLIGALHAPDELNATDPGHQSNQAKHANRPNFHAHVIVGLRPLWWRGPGALEADARRAVDALSDIPALRQRIADAFNRKLAEAGLPANFTGLSARDRGLASVPDRHRGYRKPSAQEGVDIALLDASVSEAAAENGGLPSSRAAVDQPSNHQKTGTFISPQVDHQRVAEVARVTSEPRVTPPMPAFRPGRFRPTAAVDAARSAARALGVLGQAPVQAADGNHQHPRQQISNEASPSQPRASHTTKESVAADLPATSPRAQKITREIAEECTNENVEHSIAPAARTAPWQIDIYKSGVSYFATFGPRRRASMRDLSKCDASSLPGPISDSLHADQRLRLGLGNEKPVDGVRRQGSGAPPSRERGNAAMTVQPHDQATAAPMVPSPSVLPRTDPPVPRTNLNPKHAVRNPDQRAPTIPSPGSSPMSTLRDYVRQSKAEHGDSAGLHPSGRQRQAEAFQPPAPAKTPIEERPPSNLTTQTEQPTALPPEEPKPRQMSPAELAARRARLDRRGR